LILDTDGMTNKIYYHKFDKILTVFSIDI